jgi:hypothetical protein
MSFTKINYKLRPAKTVERKMIAEAFRKLSTFHRLQEYQYIGFGSIYFVDFSLFHKSLGLHKMISIEKEEKARARVEFNRPFSCIEVYFDTSNNVLPTLDYDQPSIIWLDYDGKLDSDCLSDINTVCANIQPGGMFLITVNVQPESLQSTQDEPANDENGPEIAAQPNEKLSLSEYRLQALHAQVTRQRVPARLTGKELSMSGLPPVIKEIIENEIYSALNNRNGGLPNDQKLRFEQLFNIRYNDGASMLTFGGVFLNDSLAESFNVANFFELPFCTQNSSVYQLKMPNLTNKEVAFLDSQLHEMYDFNRSSLVKNRPEVKIIPESDINKYAQIYRFYPTFTESIW